MNVLENPMGRTEENFSVLEENTEQTSKEDRALAARGTAAMCVLEFQTERRKRTGVKM